jgi:hypothetical protein
MSRASEVLKMLEGSRAQAFQAWQQSQEEVQRLETLMRDIPLRRPQAFGRGSIEKKTTQMNTSLAQVKKDLASAKKQSEKLRVAMLSAMQ